MDHEKEQAPTITSDEEVVKVLKRVNKNLKTELKKMLDEGTLVFFGKELGNLLKSLTRFLTNKPKPENEKKVKRTLFHIDQIRQMLSKPETLAKILAEKRREWLDNELIKPLSEALKFIIKDSKLKIMQVEIAGLHPTYLQKNIFDSEEAFNKALQNSERAAIAREINDAIKYCVSVGTVILRSTHLGEGQKIYESLQESRVFALNRSEVAAMILSDPPAKEDTNVIKLRKHKPGTRRVGRMPAKPAENIEALKNVRSLAEYLKTRKSAPQEKLP